MGIRKRQSVTVNGRTKRSDLLGTSSGINKFPPAITAIYTRRMSSMDMPDKWLALRQPNGSFHRARTGFRVDSDSHCSCGND
jgi:hypothetical protein